MKSLFCALSLLLLTAFSSAAEPSGRRNPALVYWQAWAELPAIGNKEGRVIADAISGKMSPDDPAIGTIVSKAETALKLFRRAAQSKTACDWGLMAEDGPLVLLPHIPKVQMLARLALCRAQQLFAQHNDVQALEWIIDVRRAARHLAADDILVCTLSQFGLESQAITLTASHVQSLTELQRKAHLHDISLLPPLRSVAQSVRGELLDLDWAEREFTHLDGDHQPPKVPDSAEQAATPIATRDADMKMLVEQLTASNAHQLIEETKGYIKEASAACELPWKEGEVALKQLAEKIKSNGNVLARILFPELAPSRERELRLVTEQTMLRTALELGDELQTGKLKDRMDALLGLPLVVKLDEGRFVIMTQPDAPMRAVTLKIGGSK